MLCVWGEDGFVLDGCGGGWPCKQKSSCGAQQLGWSWGTESGAITPRWSCSPKERGQEARARTRGKPCSEGKEEKPVEGPQGNGSQREAGGGDGACAAWGAEAQEAGVGGDRGALR